MLLNLNVCQIRGPKVFEGKSLIAVLIMSIFLCDNSGSLFLTEMHTKLGMG